MKKFFKKWLPVLLAVSILAGVLFGVVKLVGIKTKTVSSMNFSVGAVNVLNGDFVDDDSSICTKNLIECDGLSITPDFDNSNEYQVFWYNSDELYFGCSERFSFKSKFSSVSVPAEASYCRIVIYPSQVDDNGKRIEDFKIKFYEPVKYASSLTVKVNKNQTANRYEYLSIARERELPLDVSTFDWTTGIKHFYSESAIGLTAVYNFAPDIQLSSTFGTSISKQGLASGLGRDVYFLNVSDQLKVRLTYSGYYSNQHYSLRFFDAKGLTVAVTETSPSISVDNRDLLISIPDGATFMLLEVCRYNRDFPESKIEFNLYKYLPRNEVTENLYH